MKRLYTLIAVALLLLGVTSSAGVIEIPSAQASGMTVLVATGSTPDDGPATYTLVDSPTDVDGNSDYRIATNGPAGGIITAGETFNLGKVVVWAGCHGTDCSGTLHFAAYDTNDGGAEPLPENKLEDSSTTIDCSTLALVASPTAVQAYDIMFAGTTQIINTDNFAIVAWVTDLGGSGYIELRMATSGSVSLAQRTGGATPGATNDSANWGTLDTDGELTMWVYKQD